MPPAEMSRPRKSQDEDPHSGVGGETNGERPGSQTGGKVGSRQRPRSEPQDIAFVGLDAEGRITEWNAHAERTFGLSAIDTLGRSLVEVVVPLHDALWRSQMRDLNTPDSALLDRRHEFRAVHRQGHTFPVEITIASSRRDEAHDFHAFVHDITDRRRNEHYAETKQAITHALAQSAEVTEAIPQLLKVLGESLGWPVGTFWVIDQERGVLRCEQRWRADPSARDELYRLNAEVLVLPGVGAPGTAWARGEPVSIQALADDPNSLRRHAAASSGLEVSICLLLVSGEKHLGVIEFFAADAGELDKGLMELLNEIAGQCAFYLGVITERATLVRQMSERATTDELTGVPNRRGWEEGLRRDLARARRERVELWTAILDLDHFKRFNDMHGHLAGDELLRLTAAEWRRQLRANDLLARYGGEEFAVALFPSGHEDAVMVAERLRTAMPRNVSCSIGLARWDGNEGLAALMERADRALYKAKHGGRNRTEVAPGGDS